MNSRTLPDISDELAQTVGNFTTLAELREDLRRRIAEHKRAKEEEAFAIQALDAFAALAEVRYPPSSSRTNWTRWSRNTLRKLSARSKCHSKNGLAYAIRPKKASAKNCERLPNRAGGAAW